MVQCLEEHRHYSCGEHSRAHLCIACHGISCFQLTFPQYLHPLPQWAFLAVYNLLWITFSLLVVLGFITYHRCAFNLKGKINAEWSCDLSTDGWLRIQNQLGCCDYFSLFMEVTVSQTCYACSTLPGCKGPFLKFEHTTLEH